jgi:hypothetical protein
LLIPCDLASLRQEPDHLIIYEVEIRMRRGRRRRKSPGRKQEENFLSFVKVK